MPDALSQMNLARCAVESPCGHNRPRLPKGFGVCASWPDLIEETSENKMGKTRLEHGLRYKKKKSVRVVFLDPHGLHHEGVADNDRFAAIEKLRALGKEKKFKTKKIELDGYILAPANTSPDKVPGATGKTWDDLEKQYPLLRQEGLCVEKILTAVP